MKSFIPSVSEEKKVKAIVELLRMKLSFINGVEDVIDVGSTAKGTWLAGLSDIDIYVITTDIADTLRAIQTMFPRGHIKDGQLTIWNTEFREYDTDLVIVTKDLVKREDTTRHARYFNRCLTNKMRNEIRLAKAYLKTRGVYGAEIGGIVGVAIEAIMLNTETFVKMCQLLSGVRPYIQDPTMGTERDLLASISSRTWDRLSKACDHYLMFPDFEYKDYTVNDFIDEHDQTRMILYEKTGDTAKDYQITQSLAVKVANEMRNLEDVIKITSDVFVDKEWIVVCFNCNVTALSRTKEVQCPEKYGKAFLKAHPNAHRIGNIYVADVVRKIRYPEHAFLVWLNKEMRAKGYKNGWTTINMDPTFSPTLV